MTEYGMAYGVYCRSWRLYFNLMMLERECYACIQDRGKSW